MGSFKSPARRAEDGVARVEGPEAGLQVGEWVQYWETFPHSLTSRLTSEATSAKVDMVTRQVIATFDPGLAVITRLRLGILDWNLLDEDGNPVKWDATQSASLIDGLPPVVFNWLSEHIGEPSKGARALGEPADPNMERSESVGEASGGNSEPS
jgi:hypothetical protein